jgi:hypothetical protein
MSHSSRSALQDLNDLIGELEASLSSIEFDEKQVKDASDKSVKVGNQLGKKTEKSSAQPKSSATTIEAKPGLTINSLDLRVGLITKCIRYWHIT